MRVVFMGSAPIAVPTLEYLHASHDLAAVITQPDQPAGRKRVLTPTAVKARALELGLPVWEPRKLKSAEFLDQLRAAHPDVVVVMAYGRLVPPAVLNLPKFGCINLHGSILPEHRGPCPIERGLLRGDDHTGITTFYMDEGFDTGDIIFTEPQPIGPDDSGGSLREKLSRLAPQVIARTLEALERGDAPRVPQDRAAGCHAPIIERAEARVDWTRSAADIDRLVRACDPEPGAYTQFRGQPLKVKRVRVVPRPPGTFKPGEVIEGNTVAVGENEAVALVEIQPAGKRWMSGDEFKNGYKPKAGEPLGEIAAVC
jgi:methionyl-tRNA formyltransferase